MALWPHTLGVGLVAGLAIGGAAHAAPPAPPGDAQPEGSLVVVSVNSESDELLDSALRAIQAHTQGTAAKVIIERTPIPGSDLRAQMKHAREVADEHGADGVFWLDLENDEEFLLYLFEPEGLRVLVRRVPTSVEDRPAAIESLGVIVGSSSEAIAAGETIGMTPVDTEVDLAASEPSKPEAEPEPTISASAVPAPPPPPERPSRAWRILRISLAYAGTSYAPNMRWQQGGSIAVAGAIAPRLYLGADYTVLAPTAVDEPVPLQVMRHPLAVHFGFQQPLVDWLALDAQVGAGLTIDAWKRTDTDDQGLRFVGTVAPWLYFRFFLARGLSLDIGVGAEVALNEFDYVWSCDEAAMMCPDDLVVVDPDRFRGRLRGGFSYSF